MYGYLFITHSEKIFILLSQGDFSSFLDKILKDITYSCPQKKRKKKKRKNIKILQDCFQCVIYVSSVIYVCMYVYTFALRISLLGQ